MASFNTTPSSNITIPNDWIDHGVPGLICRPADWQTVGTFLITNFVAHAVTVKAHAGETSQSLFYVMIIALFLPAMGVWRATEALQRRPWVRRYKSELERVLAMGGLVMVVRDPGTWLMQEEFVIKHARVKSTTSSGENPNSGKEDLKIGASKKGELRILLEWIFSLNFRWWAFLVEAISPTPNGDESIEFDHEAKVAPRTPDELSKSPLCCVSPIVADADSSITVSTVTPLRQLNYKVLYPPWIFDGRAFMHGERLERRRIHGAYHLPQGYRFWIVPFNAVVRPNTESDGIPLKCDVSVGRSPTKVLIGLLQIVYGSVSLYRARGDQLDLYGYSAFGLTVIPFVIMSILNLMAQAVSADLPALYMVRTPEMDEAESVGGVFDGVLGRLEPCHAGPHDGDVTIHVGAEDLVEISASQEISATHTPNFQQGLTYRVGRDKNHEGDPTASSDIIIPMCSPYTLRTKSEAALKGPWRAGYNQNKDEFKQYASQSYLAGEMVPVMYGAIVLLVFGTISKFQPGTRSDSVARGFVVAWIVSSFITSLVALMHQSLSDRSIISAPDFDALPTTYLDPSPRFNKWFAWSENATQLVVFVMCFVAPLGGMVVVARQILDYGDCTRV